VKNLFRQSLSWLNRFQSSESITLSAAALAVGVSAGVGIWLFKRLIELTHAAAFLKLGAALLPLGTWTVALLPILGGILVGLVIHHFIKEERYHGVAGIMEAVALAGGRLRFWRLPAKAVAAALSIGTGASVGPEDPSVQIGANLGSLFGQRLRLSDDRIRSLVAAGAAAGIAAAFNAPIAGVFFALEVVLGEMAGSALGVVLVTAVVSAVFTQAVEGTQPAFAVPEYAFNSAWELPLYLGLGLFTGPISAAYIRLLYFFQDFFRHLSLPKWIKPAVAGVVVGGVGIFLPQVFGVGYETIESILVGQKFGVGFLVALLIAKLFLTPISIGGGFQGGVFAPSLFLGAVLGGAYGFLAEQLFPTLGIYPAAFAMVGMAAALAGVVHAPLTAILLLFEMTRDYRIILPLMFSVAISLIVSQRLQKESVYLLGLLRKGVRLDRGRDIDVLQALKVEEIMQKDVDTLNIADSIEFARHRMLQTHHHGMPVVDAVGNLVGILTIQDIDRAIQDDRLNQTVGAICTRQLLVAYPEESIGAALRRMGGRDIGRLPVVSHQDPQRLLGWLRRADLVRAYDLALTRRAALRHTVQQVRLGALHGEDLGVNDLVVTNQAPIVGLALKDIAWPTDCLVASVRRGRRLMVPHGDTIINPGDVLVIVADEPTFNQVKALVSDPDKEAI
jgi:chloride channel protein, CIC family